MVGNEHPSSRRIFSVAEVVVPTIWVCRLRGKSVWFASVAKLSEAISSLSPSGCRVARVSSFPVKVSTSESRTATVTSHGDVVAVLSDAVPRGRFSLFSCCWRTSFMVRGNGWFCARPEESLSVLLGALESCWYERFGQKSIPFVLGPEQRRV